MDYNKASVELHKAYGGKLTTGIPFPIEEAEDLSVAYSPGVAEPCRVIDKDPERVWDLTIKGRTVAVVSDGSSVLGLGNIGAAAGIPVMEGKAALFKRFADVDAFPICLDTQDPDEIVETIKRIAPVFGGINLEDIAAPACFDIERRLSEELDIPVVHDDQHGTAIVILAGLMNAVKVVGKELESVKVLIQGAGAAGLAAAHLLHNAGVQDIVVLDSRGAIVDGRENLNRYKEEVIPYNVNGIGGQLEDVIKGRDVFIGVSGAVDVVTAEMVESMAADPIVFAMGNPDPEIRPEVAKEGGAATVGTGRSDYPNQLNNVLVFPGLFKGALEARARVFTPEMKIAAAQGLANLVADPTPEQVIPSPFDPGVAEAVADAVKNAV